MTQRIVHRPARVAMPLEPPLPTELAPPPRMTEGATGFPLQMLLPVIGAMSSVVMITVLRTNPLMVMVAAMIFIVAIVSGVGMALSQRGQAGRRRREQRELFLEHLEDRRDELRVMGDGVREAALRTDPDPRSLPDVARDPARRWERRRSHADFARLRVGVGPRNWHDLTVPSDNNPTEPYDEMLVGELEQLRSHYSLVQAMPVTTELDSVGNVSIVGPREFTLPLARALLAQAATFHAPDDLAIGFAYATAQAPDWADVDLLPHVQVDAVFDGPVNARRVAPTLVRLGQLLGPAWSTRAKAIATSRRAGTQSPHLTAQRTLIVADHGARTASALPIPDGVTPRELGITVIHLVDDRLKEPSEVSVRLTADGDRVHIDDVRDDARTSARADAASPAVLGTLCQILAPLRLSASDAREGGAAIDTASVVESLGYGALTSEEVERAWRRRSPHDFLRISIGADDNGASVPLDLKEAAQLGMGPHGICIGATGSGKSELLRTLVLGLALTHPPEDLAMVLVDYKGGAAFAPFTELPHTAGVMDNLADDAQLTRRAQTSIAGEVRRRQELLRDTGSIPSVTAYRELRDRNPTLPPMPHLLIVIDEFGELLTAEPDFVDLLLTIGRIGRSIGVHLLLSSQRIEQGKLRGLDTYLSYRIGLRTFSEAESRVILDTADAFHLPGAPGFGYLKVDTSLYTRFRAGYVSGPVPIQRRPEERTERPQPLYVPTFNTIEAEANADGDDDGAEARLAAQDDGRTMLEVSIDLLRDAERRVPPVWLPPLPQKFAFERVRTATLPGVLQTPIGLLDDPAKQRQDPWLLDLTRSGGHVSLFGAPQTGRSTFLRTVATSLALTHTPEQVSIYGLDLTGGGLGRIEAFPHVGGVASRADRERIGRLLDELRGMIAIRESLFRRYGIDSLQVLRSRHSRGEIPELISPDVVLLLDGFSSVRMEFEEFETPVIDLLARGGSFGIHLVMTLNRWNDIPMRHQSHIGQRIELRLNDPMDSQVGRKVAETLRNAGPGRALTDEQLFGQIALPVREVVEDEEIGPALEALAERVAQTWSGAAAAPIRLLPERLDAAELPDALEEPERVPIGVLQSDLSTVFFDPRREQHLLVYGDSGCGKSTLLRGIAEGFMERYSSDELVIGLIDVRSQVADVIEEPYLGGHATNSTQAMALATSIARELERRGDPEEAAKNPGPRVVLLIDDHHIAGSGGNDPLTPLLPYLPSARDLRLHVVLTRPVAGSARASFEVTLQTVRETGGTGLVMSGERSEGPVFPKVYAEQMIPGRGRLIRRGASPQTIHLADFGTLDEVPTTGATVAT